MVLSRALHAGAAILTLTAAWIAGSVASAAPVAPDAAEGAAPYLESFRCSADAAHTIGVFVSGTRYLGNVNWVPEHFVAPPGAPWEVEYANGQVRLVAQGHPTRWPRSRAGSRPGRRCACTSRYPGRHSDAAP